MADTRASGAGVGRPTPNFDLACVGPRLSDGARAALADYAGRWLLLVFYPRDFSFVCPTELTALSTRIEDLRQRDCDVLAVSVDDLETHRKWLQTPGSDGGLFGLRFPLASDPDGVAAAAYGVYFEHEQVAGRGLFIIDPKGVLQYQVVHNLSVGRNIDETLRVLDALRRGGLCPASWTRADGTIDPRVDLNPGRVWGHYRIERLLGEGGFGWVYQAWDLQLDRPVAIKLGRSVMASTRREVLNEARAAARLSHPNVCAIHAVEEADGVPMIVMEYLAGGALAARLSAGRIPTDAAWAIARQMVAGIAASHAAGLVHGDIKPANILFNDSGEAKVGDFGMARDVPFLPDDHSEPGEPLDRDIDSAVDAPPADGVAMQTTMRLPGPSTNEPLSVIRGTPAYMSPEQSQGHRPTTASDVFSTGLVLYELFTGERAVDLKGESDALAAVRHLEPEPLAERLPETLRPVWCRMVSQRPEDRPPIGEVQASL